MQGFQRLHQVSIVRRLVDGLMELAVRADMQRWAAPGGPKSLLQPIENSNLGRGGVGGGKSRRRSFEDFTHRIELDDLLLAQLCDHKAAPRPDNQKSALLQSLQ